MHMKSRVLTALAAGRWWSPRAAAAQPPRATSEAPATRPRLGGPGSEAPSRRRLEDRDVRGCGRLDAVCAAGKAEGTST